MGIAEALWFEVTVVRMVYTIGNMTVGHFEEQTPKIRRVEKYILTLTIITAVSFYFGRTVSMLVLGCLAVPVLYVHGYYLPKKKGINGWTGEPKSKYYDFRGWDKNIFDEDGTSTNTS